MGERAAVVVMAVVNGRREYVKGVSSGSSSNSSKKHVQRAAFVGSLA